MCVPHGNRQRKEGRKKKQKLQTQEREDELRIVCYLQQIDRGRLEERPAMLSVIHGRSPFFLFSSAWPDGRQRGKTPRGDDDDDDDDDTLSN